MALRHTRAENLALTLLTRDGIAAIWTLHPSAAKAYRDEHKAAAAGIIEIADAAEREWLRGRGFYGAHLTDTTAFPQCIALPAEEPGAPHRSKRIDLSAIILN
jgi:hypothetical protein